MAETEMMTSGDAKSAAPESVGARLRQAREAAGLGLPQVSEVTKIPMRMLVLIESGDFAALPARTYATGFTRTYARALGLDEVAFVEAVRAELGMASRVEAAPAPTFEPGDPARVPTARLAWLAALGAIVVLVAGLFLWRSFYAPAVTLPSLLPAEEASTAPAAPLPAEPAAATAAPATEAATAGPALTAPGLTAPVPDRAVVRRPRPERIGGQGSPTANGAAGAAAVSEPARAPQPASTGTI
ncbi:MAG: helix-turn-helix domain-containing protein [Sphingomonadales bacterium]|nr:helix-turn-helix domain-containing protein [Sphingomonadales bacterium]